MASWEAVGKGIWVRSYDFRGNPINTSAIALGDGGLMVLSPGTDLEAADFAALDELGTVKALVCPGAFHNMGFAAWHAQYPDAGMYGGDAAIAHIAKAHKTLPALQPLSALQALLPDDIEVEDAGGAKKPDLFVAVKRGDATTWFTNEVISNAADWPGSFVFRTLFKLTGSGPGLNINSLALKLIGGKKPAVRAWLEGKVESCPPTRLVPCHGTVLDDAELATRLREVFARRL